MERLAKTQLSLLAAYSSPFVLLVALFLNVTLFSIGVTEGPLRPIILSAAFPVGFAVGRLIYMRRSHIEILLDNEKFEVTKGSRLLTRGVWANYKLVSIVLDQFGRASLRLYESVDGDFVDIPASGAGADPQKLRDHMANMISKRRASPPILQPVEAS